MIEILVAFVLATLIICITLYSILTNNSFLDMIEKRKIENTKVEIEKLRLQQISMGFQIEKAK